MTTVAAALQAWEAARTKASCRRLTPPERVAVWEAAGRVTSEPVFARLCSPPFDASAMDGIAVSARDTAGATFDSPRRLRNGSYQVVDTGDPIGDGFDAVVMREDIEFGDDTVLVFRQAAPYENLRPVGEDIVAGQLLAQEGRRLRAADVAACAAAGLRELAVRARPRVAILPTGDEIRPAGTPLGPGQFYDTNSIMLAARCGELGCEAEVLEIEPDVPGRIAAAALEASETCDLLVIIAGASAGRDDHTAGVISKFGNLAVRGVAIRPGHPVMLGTIGAVPVLAAPGYPVSAALSFETFAVPLLRALGGRSSSPAVSVAAVLAEPVSSPADKEEWRLVRLARVRGELVCEPAGRGAAALSGLAGADGLLCLPPGSASLGAGSHVDVQLLVDPEEIGSTILCAGGGEPALELMAPHLSRARKLAFSPADTAEALRRLARGTCHMVGSSLFDPDLGACEAGYAARLAPALEPAVVLLARREVGLIVAAGNPLGLKGIEDLARPGLRYANRPEGSDLRRLLDHELERAGISPGGVAGYLREGRGDLAVAAAVAAGRCDCGLGVAAAALGQGLGFVPLREEPFHLVVPAAACKEALLAPLFDLLADGRFQDAVAASGYDVSGMGERLL